MSLEALHTVLPKHLVSAIIEPFVDRFELEKCRPKFNVVLKRLQKLFQGSYGMLVREDDKRPVYQARAILLHLRTVRRFRCEKCGEAEGEYLFAGEMIFCFECHEWETELDRLEDEMQARDEEAMEYYY